MLILQLMAEGNFIANSNKCTPNLKIVQVYLWLGERSLDIIDVGERRNCV